MNDNNVRIRKDFALQIKNEDPLKVEEANLRFLIPSYIEDSKVRAAKDHSQKFRIELTISFSGIVHYVMQINEAHTLKKIFLIDS